MNLFKHPWILLLMPIVGVLAGLAWNQRHRRLHSAGVTAPMPPRDSLRSRLFRHVPFWGRVLAICLLILALDRKSVV